MISSVLAGSTTLIIVHSTFAAPYLIVMYKIVNSAFVGDGKARDSFVDEDMMLYIVLYVAINTICKSAHWHLYNISAIHIINTKQQWIQFVYVSSFITNTIPMTAWGHLKKSKTNKVLWWIDMKPIKKVT